MSDAMAVAEVKVELARDHLAAGHVLRARAEGDSMWPAVRDGQLVDIQPCVGSDVRVGDVVLAARGPQLVLHRVLRVRDEQVLLKGDACPDTDGWVAREAVLGRLERRPWDASVARLGPWTGPTLVRLRRLWRGFFDHPRGRS